MARIARGKIISSWLEKFPQLCWLVNLGIKSWEQCNLI